MSVFTDIGPFFIGLFDIDNILNLVIKYYVKKITREKTTHLTCELK